KDFEDLTNFRREEDRMCDFRRNYGSVGATARLEQRWVRFLFVCCKLQQMDAIDGCSLMAPELARGNLEPDQGSATKKPLSFSSAFLVCGRRENDCLTPCHESFSIFLERTCTVASGHTRVIQVPSFPLSRRHCLFHRTFQYNNKKTSNVIKNKNRNTVGELGEKALFSMYWNGDNRCVRDQKLLPYSRRLYILTRLDVFS
ncbi:unnamed protein product, partial [Brassica rapa subsp. narinosa]